MQQVKSKLRKAMQKNEAAATSKKVLSTLLCMVPAIIIIIPMAIAFSNQFAALATTGDYSGEAAADIVGGTLFYETLDVTFEDWDGRIISSQQVPYGGNAIVPTDLRREGWTFAGWRLYTMEYIPQMSYHTVTFIIPIEESPDGEWQSIYLHDVAHGTVLSQDEVPTLKSTQAWAFDGWDTQPVGHVVTGDVVFTASISPTMHRVEFITFAGTFYGGATTVHLNIPHGGILQLDMIPEVMPNPNFLHVGWMTNSGVVNPYGYYIHHSISFTAVMFSFRSLNHNFHSDFTISQINDTTHVASSHTHSFDYISFDPQWNDVGLVSPENHSAYENLTSHIRAVAQYVRAVYAVTFVNWDGSIISYEQVYHGNDATAPSVPPREGWTFTGWNRQFTNITSNKIVAAQFTVALSPPSSPAPPKPSEPSPQPIPTPPATFPTDTSSTSTPPTPFPPAQAPLIQTLPPPVVLLPESKPTPISPPQLPVSEADLEDVSDINFLDPDDIVVPQSTLQQMINQGLPTLGSDGDTQIPLFAPTMPRELTWSSVNLILAIAGLLLAVITLIKGIAIRDTSFRKLPTILSLLAGLAGIALFSVFQNMSLLMVLVDSWTIWHCAIFTVSIICYLFMTRRNAEPSNEVQVKHTSNIKKYRQS